MRIVVAYQWACDPQEALVSSDGKIDFSRAKPTISDYDAVAIEMGCHLAEATGAELIGISAGGEAVATAIATKAALARGLHEVFVVSDPGLDSAGTLATAVTLKAAIDNLGDVGLLLTGDSSLDSGSKTLVAVLAGLLGWPCVTDVMKVTMDGDSLTIERTIPEGIQGLHLHGPVLVGVTSDAVKAKVPGMKDVLSAGKKPARVVSLLDLGVRLPGEGEILSVEKMAGPSRQQIRINTEDPAQAAAELVSALRAAGALDA
ncbi:MAG: electron transfer flavoprotein beta subunit/FixA family protein [Propionibacteriaceae bacterium]|jgi:electron transfer flavoprotein beta subunit|nr:electron transfer flavoprotein beta subunit/FixA family protein [Propionibacteriaceae bacterium]